MRGNHLQFNRHTFASEEEMCKVLLIESNEQLIKIDLGQLENSSEMRNEIRWKLMHLQRFFDGSTPMKYRSTYNSLWSQLYRLDHQDAHKRPLLQELLSSMMKEE